jgi:hypothetical protein
MALTVVSTMPITEIGLRIRRTSVAMPQFPRFPCHRSTATTISTTFASPTVNPAAPMLRPRRTVAVSGAQATFASVSGWAHA